jgi:L-ribulose-5-phosphate 4-epimerase
MQPEQLCEQVLEANLALVEHNLVIFTWGNASAIDRESGLVAIKPSGVPYTGMKPSDMVLVKLNGELVGSRYKPSSDLPTHLELYRQFPAIAGIVHTHARWSTIWAQSCRDLPSYGTTHADYFYGPIPCTRKLTRAEIESGYEINTGKVICETFTERKLDPLAVPGVLVAGHAPFAWGVDVAAAVHNAVVLEECAMMAAHTELLNPQVNPLEQELLDKHYFRKHGAGAYYGQK